MVVYSGQNAIDYLVDRADAPNPGMSSHWRKYHSSFRFTGNGFKGLQGFGGSRPPSRGVRLIFERYLQRKFRRIGDQWSGFVEIDRLAQLMTRKQDRAYDIDVLRQVLTLAFLGRHVPGDAGQMETVCVIGDGFGTMASLLLGAELAKQVVVVNLTKTLLVDLWYLRLCLGDEPFESDVELVTGDTAPEMDPPVILKYFEDLRGSAGSGGLLFYCCNREEKRLPDGTVTRFSEYPWLETDQILVDELCPWHQQYYTFRPPFYRSYDGPIRHRLVNLSKNSGSYSNHAPTIHD